MNPMPERADVMMSVEQALDLVRPGMTIALGGFINSGHPMLIVRGLIRRGVGDLTVIGGASAGLEIDLLVAAGLVRKVIGTYVGAEALAPIGPSFRAAAQAGRIVVSDMDEAHYYCGLRAAAQRVPFNPWRAGIGTSLPEINPDLKVFRDPVRGELLIAVPAFEIDIAFLHCGYSDVFGNVRHVDHGFSDHALWSAADRTIVQVEQVISNEEIRRQPHLTSLPGVDGVIRAPFGAHPFASAGFYLEDQEHIAAYVAAADAAAKTDRRAELDAYLQRFVRGPGDHVAYLEEIGLRALLALNEY